MPSAAQNPLNDGKSGSCAGAVEFSRHETPLCGISTSTRINTVSGAPFNKRGKAGVAMSGWRGDGCEVAIFLWSVERGKECHPLHVVTMESEASGCWVFHVRKASLGWSH